jgi:hypothetical protein
MRKPHHKGWGFLVNSYADRHSRVSLAGWSRLELEPRGHLAGTAAAEVRTTSRGNGAEVRIGDVQVWIGQVGVVEDVGKGSLHPQLDPRGDHDVLAEATGEVDHSGTDDRTHGSVAEATDRERRGIDGAVGEGLRGAGCSTGEAGVTWLPRRIAGADVGGFVEPVGTAAIDRSFGPDAIDVLGATGIAAALEVAGQTGAGTGGIAFATVEVRGEVRTGLPEKDIADLPSAQQRLLRPIHIRTELLAAAYGQLVDHGGAPAIAASSVDLTEINLPVTGPGGATAARFAGEAGVLGSLVVGFVLREGVVGIEGESMRSFMVHIDLQGVIARVRTRGASVDGSPVREGTCAQGLVVSRHRVGHGREIIQVGSPDEIVGLETDVGDAHGVAVTDHMIHRQGVLLGVGILPVDVIGRAEVGRAVVCSSIRAASLTGIDGSVENRIIWPATHLKILVRTLPDVHTALSIVCGNGVALAEANLKQDGSEHYSFYRQNCVWWPRNALYGVWWPIYAASGMGQTSS